MIRIMIALRVWLKQAGVDLSGVAITIHVKRDRDGYRIMSAMGYESPPLYPSAPRTSLENMTRGQIAGIPFEIRVDALQRDLPFRD